MKLYVTIIIVNYLYYKLNKITAKAADIGALR